MLAVDALKTKVAKAINMLPDSIEIYRHTPNNFGEPTQKAPVTVLTGMYYKSRHAAISSVDDRGRTLSVGAERFMVVFDETSLLVNEGDFFLYNGVEYRIIDLCNTLNVYFDFVLERCSRGGC